MAIQALVGLHLAFQSIILGAIEFPASPSAKSFSSPHINQ
jgi:hypothetical protein